jgi:hypothetical protein
MVDRIENINQSYIHQHQLMKKPLKSLIIFELRFPPEHRESEVPMLLLHESYGCMRESGGNAVVEEAENKYRMNSL